MTVACELTLWVAGPAELAVQIARACRSDSVAAEGLHAAIDGHELSVVEIRDASGGRQHLLRCGPGTLLVTYQGATPPRRATEAHEVSDADRIIALRPSRYCPSDRFVGFATRTFGLAPSPLDKVRAICDYVWSRIAYDAQATTLGADATHTLLTGYGVCRDFAHLVVTLCRAVGVPARMVAAYAPGLSPMDFHAVVETAVDGAWWCWDATRRAPRQTLVRVATGRDAADVAFVTVLAGNVELTGLSVMAIATDPLPFDDHEQLVALR
jgi:transglutaminase-like putative cysteine protease